ncbi:MAG: hypothetical protein ACRCZQ_07980, partial [Bacteroidales bacterium]
MKRSLTAEEKVKALKEVGDEKINDLSAVQSNQDEQLQEQFIVQLKIRRKLYRVNLKEIACIYVKDESIVIIALNEKQIGIYSTTLDHMKTLIIEKGLVEDFFFHRSFILAYALFEYPDLRINKKEIITRLNQ